MHNQGISDFFHFIHAWMMHPKRIGAIAPSGRALANLITSEISGNSGNILELGPGTGVFTQKMLEKGVFAHNLSLIEADEEMYALLREKFPDIEIFNNDVAELSSLPIFQSDKRFGAIVSGLPLLLFKEEVLTRMLADLFQILRDDGAFYQFTYGPKCPIAPHILAKAKLNAKHIGAVILNLPPASVYKISRI